MINQIRHIITIFTIFLVLASTGCNVPASRETHEIGKPEAVIMTTASNNEEIILEPTATQLPTDKPTIEPTPEPTIEPTPEPTKMPKVDFEGSYGYSVQFINPKDLTYKGSPTKLGNTAADIQMILDFWHSYNENFPTMRAQDLIDINTDQNQFDERTGLSLDNAKDDLEKMNYTIGKVENASKEKLLDALQKYGPLLVKTKEGWTPAGANHLAVLISYNPESGLMKFLDPKQNGGSIEFYYDSFDGIWSINYSSSVDKPIRRTFYYIVPEAILD